ncbi:prolyl-tRNA synthetase associated domain-containing protein [Candidatus Parcubacteria bacterium]|nr:prolyl-tRNA synthetase associated domain-containing protein [Candidatus Parcubacteria bacterium]
MKDIYVVLDNLNIKYEKFEHQAVFTVEEADKANIDIPAKHTKNLFLRNKKKTKFYLVVLPAHKKFNLKEFAILINDKHLSFASPEKLKQYLGLIPGAVSPLGLINDLGKEVIVYVDKSLVEAGKVAFHPNRNDATLVIDSSGFIKFLKTTGNKYELIT